MIQDPSTAWSHIGQYPRDFGRCIVCGAARSQPCDTVSDPGTPRPDPHFYRGRIGVNEPPEGFVAVRDEPDWPCTARAEARTTTTTEERPQ